MGADRAAGPSARRLIWDNEPGIGRGRRHADGVAVFTGTPATSLVRLPPKDPESKGIVERRNGFFETSFMPGREFTSPADFNGQFTGWLTRANARMVRAIRARPVDLLDADRAAMLPLRRCRRGWAGTTGFDSDATTTSVSTPMTTPSTPRRCRPAIFSRPCTSLSRLRDHRISETASRNPTA